MLIKMSYSRILTLSRLFTTPISTSTKLPVQFVTTITNYPNFEQQQLELEPPSLNASNFHQNLPHNTIDFLKNKLNIDENKAMRMMVKFPRLARINETQIQETVQYLVYEKGIQLDRLVDKIPWVLAFKYDTLNDHIKKIQALLKVDYATALPFVKLPTDRLLSILSVWSIDKQLYENNDMYKVSRIQYLAKLMELDESDIADMLCKVPGLITTPLTKIEKVLELMLEIGIKGEKVAADPYIFLYSNDKIRKRLDLIKKDNLHKLINIKPWLLRCTLPRYTYFIDKLYLENKLMKGFNSYQDFATHRLKCTPEEFHYICSKSPAFKNATATRITEIVEYLLSKGFTTTDIIASPRIFQHSVETIEKRLSEIGKTNQKLALKSICKSVKLYNETLAYYKKKDEREMH